MNLFRNIIFFESVPDLADNTKAVFDEMIKRGLYKKYKFVWVVSDKRKQVALYPNTTYIDNNSRINKWKLSWYKFCAKCLVSCNRFYGTKYSGQCSFYLTHGTAIKKLGGYTAPQNIDYILVASESIKEIMARELKCSVNKLYGLGLPRNDIFKAPPKDLHKMFSSTFNKIIVWYPTFRQSKTGRMTGSVNALPILYDKEKALRLNEFANEKETLIVIKPHFAQDTSYVDMLELSNIVFINDDFFVTNKITSYEFINSCDALITDYSSVYFDYLLADKPVAVVWEDIEDYRKNPGFALDVDYYLKAAHKIYDIEGFKDFICQVASNGDKYRYERFEINDIVNFSNDGKNTKRVVDFIVEKANL